MLLHRQRELRGRILRPLKTLRIHPPALRPLRQRAVIDQRQDGVEKRRRRQLHLPALFRLAMLREHQPHALELNLQHAPLFLLGKVPPFPFQRRQLREELHRAVPAPRQIEPHLQIEHLLVEK